MVICTRISCFSAPHRHTGDPAGSSDGHSPSKLFEGRPLLFNRIALEPDNFSSGRSKVTWSMAAPPLATEKFSGSFGVPHLRLGVLQGEDELVVFFCVEIDPADSARKRLTRSASPFPEPEIPQDRVLFVAGIDHDPGEVRTNVYGVMNPSGFCRTAWASSVHRPPWPAHELDDDQQGVRPHPSRARKMIGADSQATLRPELRTRDLAVRRHAPTAQAKIPVRIPAGIA